MKNFLNNSVISQILVASMLTLPAIAHNVQVDQDVAVTFHIEPDHNPRAGEETLAWFVLTRRGGETIPLSDCDCHLKVYLVPRNPQAQALLNPALEAINVEQYLEIPGATLIFPQAGAYDLEISGAPRDGNSFQPFKFSYTVNVR
ncbi:hypothetical protein [Gloeocapsa sp. PCC 73106]|uniref:hypothetical protein n=1 Tax=Gloeocapsa sp. PCC 73106 TaxID=102232 RepID=UPI0002AC1203|nr:hypothetical protein [Gloeocapsa sp. PCC 73106]ELR96274.1 hypothetical protein GLO73106DRAFT_00000630 [Gloeocapsa sp. PCC 73106]